MECPHILESVKLQNTSLTEKDMTKDWVCAVCSASQNPWLCLNCGSVNCGRYVNGHAQQHYQSEVNHNVCMDCENFAVYCYLCDEYIVNDTKTGQIDQIRQALSNCRRTDNDTEANSEDSSWTNSNSPSNPQNGRKLRPRTRKRSHSADSGNGSVENIQVNSSPHANNTVKMTKREKKVVGLRNLGNTCFMNAVLQSLSNIQEFCLYFRQLPSLENCKNLNTTRGKLYQSRSFRELNDQLMAEELRKVIIELTSQGSAKSAISPESLFLVIWKVVPRFRGYQQQDAHEFLRYMLDRLHTELLHLLPDMALKDSPFISLGQKGRNSIVTSVFGGMLQSEVRCLNCSIESKKHDPFLDLSLDIPEKFLSYKKLKEKDSGDESNKTPICDIFDCLTSFIEVEELAETELYYCSNCKSKQRSTKRFWIRRLPNVLCLHLKRFRWNNFFRTKVDTEINFPVNALDMSQFVLSDVPETRRSPSGTNLYDLAAVIVHHGSGMGTGHYTAFAVNDGQWFHFNDSSVRPTRPDIVAKCKPYIMFYIRREFRLPTMQS